MIYRALTVFTGCILTLFPLGGGVFAQAPEARFELFSAALITGAQIDAMDEICTRLGGKDTSMSRPVVEQLMEGFALESGTQEQARILKGRAAQSFAAMTADLEEREELDCAGSDFLWEKHALTETLSKHLKAIMQDREKDGAPQAL
jgi:hypothetical protein